MKRAARIMRRGSSVKETSGDRGVRSLFAARSATPSNGSTRAKSGRERAIALTVKSRRARSASRAVEKTTSGLRETALVLLGPVSRYLDAPLPLGRADGAKTLALGPDGYPPTKPGSPRSGRAGRRS